MIKVQNILIIFFALLMTQSIWAQPIPVSLGCLDEFAGGIVIDRKDWNGGSTAVHSEGFWTDFAPINDVYGPCKKISEFTVNITATPTVNLPPGCVLLEYYVNIFYGCNSTSPAGCSTTFLLGDFNNPGSVPTGPFTFFCTPGTPLPFGEVIGVDIIPVMDPASCPGWQSILTDGWITMNFSICVDAIVDDDILDPPLLLPPDPDVCFGETTILDAGPGFNMYQWDPNGQTSQSITEGVGVYTVTVTDSKGCTEASSITVNENPQINITFDQPDPVMICDHEVINIEAMGSGGSGSGYTYAWTKPLGGTHNFGTIVADEAGTYTVTVTDGSALGCSAVATIDLVYHTNPSVGINFPNGLDVCSNGTIPLEGFGSGGNPSIYTYDWMGPGGFNSTMQNISVSDPGTYELQVTDGNGCTSSSISVVVNQVQAPFAGNDANVQVCNDGQTVDFENEIFPFDPGGFWTDINGVGVNLTTPTLVDFSGISAGTYNFSYTVPGTPPCLQDEAFVSVTVSEAPFAGNSVVLDVCAANGNVDLVTLIGNPDPNGVWSDLDNSGVNLTAPTNVDISMLASGTYNFQYILTSAPPCLDAMATVTLNVEQAPFAGLINNPSEICIESIIDMFSLFDSIPQLGGTWTDVDGTGIDLTNPFNTDFAGVPVGSYTFTYCVSGILCTGNECQDVVIDVDQLTAGNNPDSLICAGNFLLDLENYIDGSPGGLFLGLNVDTFPNGLLDTMGILGDTVTLIYYVEANGSCAESRDTFYFAFEQMTDDLLMMEDICDDPTYSVIVGGDTYNMGNPSGSTTLTNQFGCDSVVTVNLDFNVSTDFMLQEPHCSGSGYELTIGNMTFNESNPTGMVTIPNAVGCDSVVDVELIFSTALMGSVMTQHCVGDGYSIQIGTEVFDEQNPMGTSTIQSTNGCDSIVTVNLSFVAALTGLEQSQHCSGDGYSITVGSETFNEANPSGTSTIPSSAGCDSIVTVNLMFAAALTGQEMTNHCQGDGYSITIGSETFDENNPIGTSTIQSSAGCDSIVSVNLNFEPGSTGDLQTQHCVGDGYSITIGGMTFDESNPSGQAIIPAANGCDSTIEVALGFVSALSGMFAQQRCQGDGYSITIGGMTFDETMPTGQVTLASSSGCDSIVTVMLTFDTALTGMEESSHCSGDGYSIVIGGQTFDEANPTGNAMTQSVEGCDSIVTVNLMFNLPTAEAIMEQRCQGDGYVLMVGSDIYNEANPSGQTTLVNSENCDSIVTINLDYSAAAVNINDNSNHCVGDGFSVIYGSDTYDENNPSGTTIIQTPGGCDSTVVVDLAFNGPGMNTISDQLCENETIVVGGETISINNNPSQVILPGASQFNCDSIIVLDISFLSNTSSAPAVQICEGDSIFLAGAWQTTAGSYIDSLTNVENCDSIITTDLSVISCMVTVNSSFNAITCFGLSNGSIIFDVTAMAGYPYTYQLTFNSMAFDNGIINSANDQIQITDLAIGGYELEIFDSAGNAVYYELIGIAAPMEIMVSASVQNVACFGDMNGMIELTVENPLNGYTVDWDNGLVGDIVDQQGVGIYSGQVTDGNGCTATFSYEIQSPDEISFDVNATDISCLDGNLGTISIANLTGGVGNYTTSIDGVTFADQLLYNGLPFGEYTVDVIDDNGCMISAENVQINENNDLQITLDDIIAAEYGNDVTFNPNFNFIPALIEWTPAIGLSCSDCSMPTLNATSSGTYVVTAISDSGCMVTDSIQLLVADVGFYIPNAFSPNGDQNNDSFFIHFKDPANQTISMQVYDRWGNLVFNADKVSGDDPMAIWDGKFEDRIMANGVYVYLVQIETVSGDPIQAHGEVLILR